MSTPIERRIGSNGHGITPSSGEFISEAIQHASQDRTPPPIINGTNGIGTGFLVHSVMGARRRELTTRTASWRRRR